MAEPIVKIFATQDYVDNHASNNNNPHNVTAEQVGALEYVYKEAALPASSPWNSIAYGDGKFVAVASTNGTAAYSTDGITWTNITILMSANWNSVTYGDGKFVAVAANGTVACSTDGVSWTTTTLDRKSWYSVTYGDGKFVAVSGMGYSACSTDGINWITSTIIESRTCSSVTYGDGKFVTVINNYGTAAYSTDGINWITTDLPFAAYWNSVTYGDGKFVAVAKRTYSTTFAAYSTDGITWTESNLSATANWYSVTYGDGKFVAVADANNTAAYSTDGVSWTNTTLPVTTNWYSVTYGDGKFVAVSNNNNTVAYSTDGITWTDKLDGIFQNGEKISLDQIGAVGYTPQSLTEPQKSQARTNIGVTQADWNQSDENAADYIKNKPFYEGYGKVTVVSSREVVFEYSEDTEMVMAIIEPDNATPIGEPFTINWDGNSYECNPVDTTGDGSGGWAYGNLAMFGMDDTGEPFIISCEGGMLVTVSLDQQPGTHTISIESYANSIVKIDPKFIEYPPIIGVPGGGYKAEVFNQDDANPNAAIGSHSHAEGSNTTAFGNNSHAEGVGTVASGSDSHAEGCYTTASGDISHAEGIGTVAASYAQHVQGRYNIKDTNKKYLHIVGNGDDDDIRSNAHTLDWEGNAWFAGLVETNKGLIVGNVNGNKTEIRNHGDFISLHHPSSKTISNAYDDTYYSSLVLSGYCDDIADLLQITSNIGDEFGSSVYRIYGEHYKPTPADISAVAAPITASVGQTIIVKAVDANGRPTEWEAVDVMTESRVNELIAAALAAIPNAEEASF